MQRVFIVLCVIALPAGCDVESRHPASDEASHQDDPRLLGGYWYDPADKSGEVGALEFRAVEGRTGVVECIGWLDGKQDDEPGDPFLLTNISDKTYTSIRQDGTETVYHIAEYRFTNKDTLKVRLLDADAIKQAISKGLLTGTVNRGKRGIFAGLRDDFVTLTASTAELRDYLREHGDECFSDEYPIVLERRRSPPPQRDPQPAQQANGNAAVAIVGIVAIALLLLFASD